MAWLSEPGPVPSDRPLSGRGVDSVGTRSTIVGTSELAWNGARNEATCPCHPRAVTNALVARFLLRAFEEDSLWRKFDTRRGVGREPISRRMPLSHTRIPDFARILRLSIDMPSQTAHETTNSSPHTVPSYPPADFGYARAPQRVDAISAMLRYPLLVIIPVLVLGAVGYVLAGKKKTTYQAQSQVMIGQPSPGTSGELPGVVQAEQSLAGIYAREIDFNQVLVPLARQFQTTPANIASHLSASPDPQSPLVRINATGGNSADAVALANAAASKFASSMNSLTQSNAPVNQVYGQYRRAVVAYQHALAKQHQVQHRLANSGVDPVTSSDPGLIDANVATQLAQQHQMTLANQYQSLLTTQSNAPTLTVFESAAGATTNHASNLEIYVFGGLVAGLLIGAALATLLANRRHWQDARFD